MTANIVSWVLSGCSIIISMIALYSSIKTGDKQIEISELQSALQEKQVEIRELQTGLQEKQVSISQIQIDAQNKVELYVLAAFQYQNINGMQINVPIIVIKNIGNNVVYLEKFIFNGIEHLIGQFVLPSTKFEKDACYTIDLPRDGINHVSFQISFTDWQGQAWSTTGYADFIENSWKLTYSPCVKNDKT